MLCSSRTSESLTLTLSLISEMLNSLPPCSGIRLSTSSTSASSSTSRFARLDPMKPSPPVMITRRSLKTLSATISRRTLTSEQKPSDLAPFGRCTGDQPFVDQKLSPQGHLQTADVLKKLLPVQKPAHVFCVVSMLVRPLNHHERPGLMDDREPSDIEIRATR